MTTILATILLTSGTWSPVTVSHYGQRYDRGKHRMANGRLYARNGHTCATWRYPLGTRIKLRANGRTLTLTVTDRTARRFKNRIDLPDGTWLSFGYPRSKGLFTGHVRRNS